ncbi:MAG: hypothetical protein JST80_00320 [Bdellovibrionales bacterium]|nr:hypothetical protein [Bdellovibrionales bacterium]
MNIAAMSFIAGCAPALKISGPVLALSQMSPALVPTFTLNVQNGVMSIDLTCQQSLAGKIYYAVYDTDLGTLTSAQVKASAQGSIAGSLVANGTITVDMPNSDVIASIESLADKKRYILYVTGESTAGQLAADASVKKILNLIPNRQSKQVYNTVLSGKGGIEMRYTIHMPRGYYNDTNDWPFIIYIHGGEGVYTDSGNDAAGTNFAMLQHTPLVSRLLTNIDDIPMIQATLQCNASFFSCTNQSEPAMYNEFINYLKANYRINAKRIYVIGMSWGGSGVWNFNRAYPTHAAATLSMSGQRVQTAAQICSTIGANNIPFWATINANDYIYSAANMQTAINDLKACSGYTADARYTQFSGTLYPATINTHMTAEYTLNAPFYNFSSNLWQWLNGSTNTNDTNPPTHRQSLAPEMTAELAAASTQYGVTLNSVFDWLMLWSKP